ncbi:hypothetical protein BU15DRAFT_69696 [Melanogaster broomeanus]|nr:hypothetical protein BU15DRAFT_69696 [Melanogaster broomeanus]
MARGPNRASFMWGTSTHNTRIERMWVETGVRFTRPWRAFFHRLEWLHQLDHSNQHHLWLLHYLFLAEINADCATFTEEWNAHPISGEGHNESPNDMRFMGQLEHGLYMEDEITLHPGVLNHYYGSNEHQHEDNSEGSDADWEDLEDEGDAGHHADLPSRIAEEQAVQFLHEAAEVPGQTNPFDHQDLENTFMQALNVVQELGHIPSEFGIREEEWDQDGYSEMETIKSGRRGRRELIVELPHSIWYPRSVRWCQALEVISQTLTLMGEAVM